jgi:excisionase family DNA binding protein
MSDHLTPRAAAARLGVSTRTLRRYVAAGLLTPASRTPGGHGRFDPADLDALREAGTRLDEPVE